MSEITEGRWQLAQEAEKKYWGAAVRSPEEFLHLLEEKYAFIARINAVCPPALQPPAPPGRVLEIGIGPLGLGVATFLEPQSKWIVTGVDPLPRTDSVEIPEYLAHCYNELKKRPLHYVQRPAEEFNTGKDSFDLAICYNVLDHTRDPQRIVNNVSEMLVPGGYFLLFVTTISFYSKYRKKILRHSDLPHPHKFQVWELFRILDKAGLEIVWYPRKSSESLRRLFGRGKRDLLLITRKPS
jgi:2-polyprenyl-3-methyl-5-hydroxy-6-metoxy-1,4-benzoquinol methylase